METKKQESVFKVDPKLIRQLEAAQALKKEARRMLVEATSQESKVQHLIMEAIPKKVRDADGVEGCKVNVVAGTVEVVKSFITREPALGLLALRKLMEKVKEVDV